MTSATQPDSPASIWGKCMEIIAMKVNVMAYRQWFEPIRASDFQGKTLTLEVPSEYFAETLESQYLKVLGEALRAVIGPEARLQYSYNVGGNPSAAPDVVLPGRTTPGERIGGGYNPQQRPESNLVDPFKISSHRNLNIDPQLNQKFTFDNYIEGNSNKLARSVAMEVAQKPGKTLFNPLFVFGVSGCGKTHLIQAIGTEVKRTQPDLNVVYVSAWRLSRQYADAAFKRQVTEFHNFYQLIDVLIIDDIQELKGKVGTEGAFFQIFNTLQQNNKQIVIAADRKPAEIDGLEDRMLTRLKAGLVAEIQPPDYEMRVNILKNRIAQDGIKISDEVIEYLAVNLETTMRELEGSVFSLLAYASHLHTDITIDVARSVVSNLTKKENCDNTVENIVDMVCSSYGISLSEFKKDTRRQNVVIPRQVAMYLSKKYAKTSLATIGNIIAKRNHSTVIYAAKQVEDRMSVDKEFKRRVQELEMRLSSEFGNGEEESGENHDIESDGTNG